MAYWTSIRGMMEKTIEQLLREIETLKVRVAILEEDTKILQLQLDLTQESIDAVFDL
jgi:chaperonin cofactor prefoldin